MARYGESMNPTQPRKRYSVELPNGKVVTYNDVEEFTVRESESYFDVAYMFPQPVAQRELCIKYGYGEFIVYPAGYWVQAWEVKE